MRGHEGKQESKLNDNVWSGELRSQGPKHNGRQQGGVRAVLVDFHSAMRPFVGLGVGLHMHLNVILLGIYSVLNGTCNSMSRGFEGSGEKGSYRSSAI